MEGAALTSTALGALLLAALVADCAAARVGTQAGVGLGLALQLRGQAPEAAATVVPVVVVSTVVFELLGPVATRVVITRAGEPSACGQVLLVRAQPLSTRCRPALTRGAPCPRRA